MRRFLPLIIGVFLLGGCLSPGVDSVGEEDLTDGVNLTSNEEELIAGCEELATGKAFGLCPPEFEVSNFKAGDRAEFPILLHNGSDSDITVALLARLTQDTRPGYYPSPSSVVDWITSKEVDVPARSNKVARVVLEVPKGIDNLPSRWEFRIFAKDITQTAFIQTAYQVRILVSETRRSD